ncbi:ionic transporter y4hA, partial [Vibrio cholerae]|nr:ionic transporter y4hA [Vibrio cholerae]
AAIFIYLDQPLTLGLNTKETIMLALTLLVSTQTISTGKTTLMQGVTHIVLFATFLFMSVFP